MHAEITVLDENLVTYTRKSWLKQLIFQLQMFKANITETEKRKHFECGNP